MLSLNFGRVVFFISALIGCASSACGQVPSAPTELVAQASAPGDLAISIFWIDNANNEQGFEIQRRTGGVGNPFVTIDVVFLSDISSYVDAGLDEKTTYAYRVLAFNSNGNSEFSNVDNATTSWARPWQIADLQGSYANGNVSLSWTDQADNETRFEVERAEEGVSTAYEVIATLEPNTLTYVDATAKKGTSYSYRIVPWRYDVAGGAPVTVSIATGTGIKAPASFTALGKTRTIVELNWKGNFSNRVVFQIQRFDFNTGLWSDLGTASFREKRFFDRGLTTGTFYSYRIRAVTDAAVSPWETASATTK